MEFPASPWRLAFNPDVEELARLQGRTVEPHQCYTRDNDGSWRIVDATGVGIGIASFQGTAKRGQGYLSPDPVGMAVGHMMAAAPELRNSLKAVCAAYADLLRSDYQTTGNPDPVAKDKNLSAAYALLGKLGE